jgi:hypothetical protein
MASRHWDCGGRAAGTGAAQGRLHRVARSPASAELSGRPAAPMRPEPASASVLACEARGESSWLRGIRRGWLAGPEAASGLPRPGALGATPSRPVHPIGQGRMPSLVTETHLPNPRPMRPCRAVGNPFYRLLSRQPCNKSVRGTGRSARGSGGPGQACRPCRSCRERCRVLSLAHEESSACSPPTLRHARPPRAGRRPPEPWAADTNPPRGTGGSNRAFREGGLIITSPAEVKASYPRRKAPLLLDCGDAAARRRRSDPTGPRAQPWPRPGPVGQLQLLFSGLSPMDSGFPEAAFRASPHTRPSSAALHCCGQDVAWHPRFAS